MHPNPVYHTQSEEINLAYAALRGFGVLSVNGDDGPLMAHVPFCIDRDTKMLEAHLMRSNPIVRAIKQSPQKAIIAVTGPDGYISPDWYGVVDQVPTWNYVAVHLRGDLILAEDAALDGVLDRLSAEMEGRLVGKTPWTSAKMDPTAYSRMKRQIVPVTMQIKTVDATWKLSQNKPVDVAKRAIEGIRNGTPGQETDALAEMMGRVVDERDD